jgi:hypothetical protein
MADEKFSIFISYQWDIQSEVIKIKEALKGKGYESWMDINNLHVGNKLTDEITKAIRNADVFIACLTKKYVESKYCYQEIHYAVGENKKLIPIFFEDIERKDLKGIGLLIASLIYQKRKINADSSCEVNQKLMNGIERYLKDFGLCTDISNLKIVEEVINSN